ncbi:MAG: hypothetical protein EOP51_23160, partial [Sphingobacteriales bacterium]
RKLNLSTLAVTTIAGSSAAYQDALQGVNARFSSPTWIEHYNGELFITDNYRLRRMNLTTTEVSTLAGTGSIGIADGTGIMASFNNSAFNMMSDGKGSLYISDNTRIRQINIASATVKTIAGSGANTSIDGIGLAAGINNARGMALSGDGSIFIAESGSYRIRKLNIVGYTIAPTLSAGLTFDSQTGTINGTPTVTAPATDYTIAGINEGGASTSVINLTVIAGTPTIDSFTPTAAGPGYVTTITGTNFINVSAVTIGGTPVQSYNVLSATTITAVVGEGTSGTVSVTTPLGTGSLAGFTYLPAPIISYTTPVTLTVTGSTISPIDVTNTGGAVTPGAAVTTTLAGSTSGNVNNTGTLARFSSPFGTASDGTYVYVTDRTNHQIKRLEIATGIVTLFAGSTSGYQDGDPLTARFNQPSGITYDGNGNLFVSELGGYRIRKIVIATGQVSNVSGNGSSGYTNGSATDTRFTNIQHITTDGTNLYVTETSGHLIRKVVIATGVSSVLAGSQSSAANTDNTTGTLARFNSPQGITYLNGSLYVADASNGRIRRINLSNNFVTTIAGSNNVSTSVDGNGISASLTVPTSINSDGGNLLYFSEAGSMHKIRKINIATTAVTTIAGTGSGSADGTGTSATFSSPNGLSFSNGKLFVADVNNHRIRTIVQQGFNISPSLSTGLVFDHNTGTISGTPVTPVSATVYKVLATNNISASSTSLSITIVAGTPAITSISPTTAAPGQTVLITGTNLDNASTVTFGGVNAATFTVESSTSIVAVVGSGAAGDVVVTTPVASATISGFTILSAPSISYTTPQTYTSAVAITPLNPVNTGGAIPATAVGLTSTLAGSNAGYLDANGTAARFSNPTGAASD